MDEKITVRAQKIVKNRTKFKMIVFGGLAVLVILIASLAPYLTPYDPYEQNLSIALQPPGGSHLLGTDRYGRDMLSRNCRQFRPQSFPLFCWWRLSPVWEELWESSAVTMGERWIPFS